MTSPSDLSASTSPACDVTAASDVMTTTTTTATDSGLPVLLDLDEVQFLMRELADCRPAPMEETPAVPASLPTQEEPEDDAAPCDANNNNEDKDDETQEKIDRRSLEVELQKAKSGEKPSLSYIALISFAIHSASDQRMVLGDIYSWVSTNFPYFRPQDRSWRNSIRHNLSLNECFIKSGRSENGKGNYWAIHPANVDDFRRGDFRRRRARRQVRKSNARFEKFHGHKMSGRAPAGLRGMHMPHCDVTSYVPMTAVAMSDADVIATFGEVVLRSTRERPSRTDTSPQGYSSPTPSPPAARGAAVVEHYMPHPADGTQRLLPVKTPFSSQQNVYPCDYNVQTGLTGYECNDVTYSQHDAYYGQVAPHSSCDWQHQPSGGSTHYVNDGRWHQGSH